MNNRASVFIPIVPPENGSRDFDALAKVKLIEVYSESKREVQGDWATLENKAIDKYWELIATPLRANSPMLYKSGCVAVNAVRKLQFKKPVLGVFQFFKPDAALEAQRLYAVSVAGPTEGNSAELGLAIALVSSLCNIQNCIIVATGALTASDSMQSNLLIRQDDVKIQSVSQMSLKLAALVSDIKSGVFSEIASNKKILVFTPKYHRQGNDEFEVAQIPEVEKLKALGVTVIPVNWLSEVFSALQANRTRYLFQDQLLLSLLVLLIIVTISYFSWAGWRDSHIPMAFIQAGSQGLPAEPFELCKLGNLQYAVPLAKKSSVPAISVKSTIAWKTVIGDSNSIDAVLAEQLGYQGYYIIVIVVSEYSPISFDYVRKDNTNVPLRVRPGDFYEGWIKLNDTAEVNVLMVLAQRVASVDIEQLRTKFNQQFSEQNSAFPANIKHNVDAVSDFFAELLPGTLTYPFVTVMEKSQCIS